MKKKTKVNAKVAKRAQAIKKEKAVQPKLNGLDMDEVIERGIDIVTKSEAEKDPEISKAQRVYMRMTQDIPHDLRVELTARDAQFHDLVMRRDAAQKDNLIFTVADLERKASKRMEEVLYEWADKSVPDYIATGKIIKYMDEEDKEKFVQAHAQMEMAIEVLDSTLVDVLHLIQQYFPGYNVKLGTIEQAKEDFEKYISHGVTIPKTEDNITFRNEECDKVYDYLKERYAMLAKKIMRNDMKLAKQREKDLDIINNV